MYLVDTNVLIRLFKPEDKHYETACKAVQTLLEQGDELILVPQVASEFWNVSTRPVERNGLGKGCAETEQKLESVEQVYRLCLDTPAIYPAWRKLVKQYGVKGVKVHDTKLVAAMQAHGIQYILTFNVNDFRRYEGIVAVHPKDV